MDIIIFRPNHQLEHTEIIITKLSKYLVQFHSVMEDCT